MVFLTSLFQTACFPIYFKSCVALLIDWFICSSVDQSDSVSVFRSWTEHAGRCSSEWSSWFPVFPTRKWRRNFYTSTTTSTTFSSDMRGMVSPETPNSIRTDFSFIQISVFEIKSSNIQISKSINLSLRAFFLKMKPT